MEKNVKGMSLPAEFLNHLQPIDFIAVTSILFK